MELISKQQEFPCLMHEENPLLHTTTGAEHLQTPGCLLNIGPSNSVPIAKTRSELHEPKLQRKVCVLLWFPHRGIFHATAWKGVSQY